MSVMTAVVWVIKWLLMFDEAIAAHLVTCICWFIRVPVLECVHNDVIKWKHFPLYWPFVRGIDRSPVNSQHKGQWRWSFDVFFDLHLIKRLSKHWRGWWFETLSHPLWRHCNLTLTCQMLIWYRESCDDNGHWTIWFIPGWYCVMCKRGHMYLQ